MNTCRARKLPLGMDQSFHALDSGVQRTSGLAAAYARKDILYYTKVCCKGRIEARCGAQDASGSVRITASYSLKKYHIKKAYKVKIA